MKVFTQANYTHELLMRLIQTLVDQGVLSEEARQQLMRETGDEFGTGVETDQSPE